ncbi:MAG: hypothetical protein U0003_04650 [Vampirovibrionales bacterium]
MPVSFSGAYALTGERSLVNLAIKSLTQDSPEGFFKHTVRSGSITHTWVLDGDTYTQLCQQAKQPPLPNPQESLIQSFLAWVKRPAHYKALRSFLFAKTNGSYDQQLAHLTQWLDRHQTPLKPFISLYTSLLDY